MSRKALHNFCKELHHSHIGGLHSEIETKVSFYFLVTLILPSRSIYALFISSNDSTLPCKRIPSNKSLSVISNRFMLFLMILPSLYITFAFPLIRLPNTSLYNAIQANNRCRKTITSAAIMVEKNGDAPITALLNTAPNKTLITLSNGENIPNVRLPESLMNTKAIINIINDRIAIWIGRAHV